MQVPAGETAPDLAIGLVVIGRNEGERLRRCLASIDCAAHPVVYVDSGSTDGSVALAAAMGAEVVTLATPPGFSAARARNAGLTRLIQNVPELAFVQFVDGDCTIAEGWLETACAALRDQADLAIVFGRRREQRAEANIYHRACDREWAVPPGEVSSCGGDAMARVAALRSVGLYNPALIAGEEPDLCLRLRQRGWTIRCIDAPMTVHDVAIGAFGQWWRRSRRTGFAIAQLVHMHGVAAEPSWRRYLVSTVLWVAVTVAALFCLLAAPVMSSTVFWLAGLVLIAGLAIQLLRLARRMPEARRRPLRAVADGGLVLVTKLASLVGIAEFAVKQLRGRDHDLIEYKGSQAS